MTTSARGEMPLPPQDDLAEQHVLGTALMSAAAVDIVRELTADHFTPGRRHDVFRAIVALDSSGVPVEPETVLEELTRRGRPDSGPLLLDLQQCAVTAESFGHWIERLRSAARDRAGMQIGQRLGQLYGQPPSEHRDQALAETADQLAELVHAATDRTAGIGDRYPALDWAAIWDTATEDTEWLVEPVLERGRLYAVFSCTGVGKSLLLLEISAALASGHGVLGNPPGKPITVLYVDLENSPADLVERLSAFGYGPQDLGRLKYLSFPSLPALDSVTGGQHLAEAAVHYGAELVVIDTLSRVVAGKENDSDTYHALYRYALAPLKARGITVVRLDHAGKDTEKGQRGSSAKDSDVDMTWQLEQITQVAFRLTRGKHRNNHSPERIDLERRFSPLRHEITRETGLDPAVADLVAHLDRLGVPTHLGRPKATAALAKDGIKGSATNIGAAIKYRKTLGKAGTPGPAQLHDKTCSEQVGEQQPPNYLFPRSGQVPPSTQVTPVPNSSGTGGQDPSKRPVLSSHSLRREQVEQGGPDHHSGGAA